jgi:acyl-coenzyme A synthetase/AMP-(fatty) acid ligase
MDAVARMLARLGVRAGERVAMVVGNRTEFVEFFFGSMRMGAIPLPLNTRLAAPTLKEIISRAGCVAALFDPSAHRQSMTIGEQLPLRRRVLLDQGQAGFLSFEEEMVKPAAPVEPPFIEEKPQAFRPYTSGSTGPQGRDHDARRYALGCRL